MRCLMVLLLAAGFSAPAFADGHGGVPHIYLMGEHSEQDPRINFKHVVLRKILEVTTDAYGPLELELSPVKMERDRQLQSIAEGKLLQVGIEATKTAWEERLLPVCIPLDKGLVGWRISLIRGDSQAEINQIETLEDLKKIPAGTGSQWSSTKALEAAGFNTVPGDTYEGLFKMLKAGRFDMFHRGINEVFDEYDQRKNETPWLAVDEHVAVVMPLPMYIFVTPKRPKLRDRLEMGLKQLIANGWLDGYIDEVFGEAIRRADLKNRKIFYIDNPNVSKETTPLDVKEYWFRP